MPWKPITIENLNDLVQEAEKELNAELLNFWQLIRINPEKWIEETQEVNGFWAVGLIGKQVIWYNDIEEGFNISSYKAYGTIDEYFCNQDKLTWTVNRLYQVIKFGEDIIGDAGPPISI